MSVSRSIFASLVSAFLLVTARLPAGSQSVAAPSPAPAPSAPVASVAPRSESAATPVSMAAVESVPELGGDAATVRAALLARLRFAFGERNVVDGEAPGAAVAVRSTLARGFGGYDLAVTVTDRATNLATTEHYRFTDLAAPTSAAKLVALVDRDRAPRSATATPAPLVALAPLDAPAALRDTAVAASALLAARIHEASGATVIALASPDATVGAPPGTTAQNPRMLVIGGLARSGSAYDLHLAAYATDRTVVGDLHVTLRDLAAFPSAAVFAPFLATSLDAAPPPDVATPVDVSILPFSTPPELADAADVARTALVDRMIAGGIAARAVPTPRGAMSLTGTLSRAPTGYHLDLVGTSAATGGRVSTGADLLAPALVPPTAAVLEFVAAVEAARPAPAHRLVFVPFENPSNKDGYIGFANAQYTKVLAERGYAVAPQPGLDPVDARLGATDLCKTNAADGILLGTHIDHDQVYHKGALRTFGSFLGFFTFGLGNAVVNGLGNIASDDRYVNHANVSATLVDCTGKRRWNKTVQGGNSHYGRNAAAGGSGAISDAIGQLVASMFADAGLATDFSAPASPSR